MHQGNGANEPNGRSEEGEGGERTAAPAGLTLRERKKLRTRRALVEEALRLFTEKGFGETTLDELVDAVEISQRTFFRNFQSKEDVALAPEKELWAAYVARIESRPPGSSPLADYEDVLFAAVREMAEGWERRFLCSRSLCDRTPALLAHSLRHCAEVTDRVLRVSMAARPAAAGRDPESESESESAPESVPEPELRFLLLIELMLAAWRWAVRQWAAAETGADREALYGHMRDAFEAIPDAAALARH